MIILAQRWTDGTPSQKFPAPKVEALVWAEGKLWSCFYDPNAGEDFSKAGGWWERGVQGISFAGAALGRSIEIVSGWTDKDQLQSLQQYQEAMQPFTDAAHAVLADEAKHAELKDAIARMEANKAKLSEEIKQLQMTKNKLIGEKAVLSAQVGRIDAVT